MPIVVDASVAVSWCLPDESSDYARQVLLALRNGETGSVPPLWPVEVVNALVVAKRRARMSENDMDRAMVLLGSMGIRPVHMDLSETLTEVRRLAETNSLTAYDASYVHLALREDAALATLDERLRAAARSAGCRVFEPAAP
ncbi:MAG: type II toxin-antitoxin system VapC family toxin [Dehalococcoidia bacterium]